MAQATGVNIPLHSAEHFYVITKPVKGITPEFPVLRDPDGLLYSREWGGGLCFGGFELNAKPVFGGAKGVPHDFSYGLFEEDWDHFAHIYDYGAERFPFLEEVEIQSMINGPESFTIDMHYIMGESPDLSKLYVCTGMCSTGIASAGGAGFALAEWIVNG
jgi:pyruvate dehydrogenase phosphatase regulatory subunit